MTNEESKTIAVLVSEQRQTNKTLTELKEAIKEQNGHYVDTQLKIEKTRNIAENAETIANETRCAIEDKDTGLKIRMARSTTELGLIKWIGGSIMTILTAVIVFMLTGK